MSQSLGLYQVSGTRRALLLVKCDVKVHDVRLEWGDCLAAWAEHDGADPAEKRGVLFTVDLPLFLLFP